MTSTIKKLTKKEALQLIREDWPVDLFDECEMEYLDLLTEEQIDENKRLRGYE